MTADEIIRRFDELPTNIYPLHGQPVTIDGDEWAGQRVVKVSDLLYLLSWLLACVDARRGGERCH